ncbi:UDP-N-acetylmuramoyl-L-alanyl-D-glutamate--2,6-diaminopimelate ligase [uncultured Traorella sp.]|uniref:Mur ligase family protein n=1 Tax=uncultured Traorella sp. TaxID=1929048 RepID=UPI0025F2E892|nr:UDP-N-acetylmuramoyl-L-alanyl-D-glutamate--2,6-diaminopimelate ligase [uncultured Traorella sp.]
MPRQLKECLQAIGLDSEEQRLIYNVSHDSRECDENSIYAGDRYREDALARKAYVVEERYLGELLRFFYDDPSAHYFVIGVTGTNGKTSVTHFLKQMLTMLGYRCIRLGTQVNEFEEKLVESDNTTMNVMDNLKVFLKYRDKIDCIIMEASSHAIEENRLAFIRFDRIIYTNITPEHLDYHLTFTHYQYSKFKLRFYLKQKGKILIHYDQLNLRRMLQFERERVIPYGIKGRFQLRKQAGSLHECHFSAQGVDFVAYLAGEHTIMNLGAVLACLKSMDIELERCVPLISRLRPVDGRMEIFELALRSIVIDYAHTPDSLAAVCMFLKKHAEKRLICVFGCGGERDHKKRAPMALIAASVCDEVIVTEDNSRNEPFEDIVKDMRLERFHNVTVIEKREEAVRKAFVLSKFNDIILLAGKGNEQFLIAKGVKTPYNDKACICQCERG